MGSWFNGLQNFVDPIGNNFLGTNKGLGILNGPKGLPTDGGASTITPLGTNTGPQNYATGHGEFSQGLSQNLLSNGEPATPNYNSIRGADGQLMSQYKVNPGTLGGSSSWVNMMKGKNDAESLNMMNDAATQSQSGTDQAMSSLAMNGGLSSGARERLAASGGRDLLNARQDVTNQTNLNGMNIDLQGEQMNQDANKFNITNDLAAQGTNSSNAINDVSGFNAANMTGYTDRMNDYIGLKLAQAQAQAAADSAKHSGLLGGLGLT